VHAYELRAAGSVLDVPIPAAPLCFTMTTCKMPHSPRQREKATIARSGQSLALELLCKSDQADSETECRLPARHVCISGFEDYQKLARYPDWLTCQSAQDQIVRAI
jgi:hypothetical protein